MTKRVAAFLRARSLVVWITLSAQPASIAFSHQQPEGSASDCGLISVDWLLKNNSIGVVFRGTVTESRPVADGFLVTFRVGRVWKGEVYRETVIYQLTAWPMYPPNTSPGNRDPTTVAVRPSQGALPFETGGEYFVSMQLRDPRDPRDLERFKADGFVRGSAHQCVTLPIDRAYFLNGGPSGAPPRPN